MVSVVREYGKSMPERSSLAAWEQAQQSFGEASLGGRLQFTDDDARGSLLRFTLSPLKIEKSYRLSRQFGIDRFLSVNLPGLSGGDLPKELRSKDDSATPRQCLLKWIVDTEHHFLGRKWRAFYVKQDKGPKAQGPTRRSKDDRFKMYMFAEDGPGFRRGPAIGEVDPRQPREYMTVQDMLHWFMPAEPNKGQSALKLFARLQLAVSKTVPTITFTFQQIIRTDDARASKPQLRRLSRKRSDQKNKRVKPSLDTSPVMNDGCARISKAAAKSIAEHLGLLQVPCAFQGRLGGAKGMWMVDSTEESLVGREDEHWIEITDSQLKFEGHPSDAFSPQANRLTFEVNDFPKRLAPSSLNFQLMPILQNGGVPGGVFEDLLKDDLWTKESELKVAMDDPRSLRLWNQRTNPVTEMRAQAGGIEFLGGLPESVAERINWFIEHGFHPNCCQYLKEQLYKSIMAYCLRLEAKMDVGVGQSTYAFMLADPLAILEEDEVQLCFSGSFHDSKSGFDEAMLHNQDVLVARLPAHLPSDIQRVRAVFKPELRVYRDVIIFSSKGSTSLASKLSGGDYDGDKAWVCWEPKIVGPYKNSPLPEEPPIETYGITKDAAKTSDFIEKGRLTSAFIRHGFDFNLQFSMLGHCTHYHEAYCYSKNSINTPEAQEMAHLLGLLVDSAKGGFIFKESTWINYLNMRKLPHNLCKPAYKDRDKGRPTNHLIDRLVFVIAKRVRQETLCDFAKHFKDVSSWDTELTRIGDEEAEEMKKDPEYLALMRALIAAFEKIFTYWKENIRKDMDDDFGGSRPTKKSSTGPSFRAVVEACRSDFLAIAPTAPEFKGEPESDRIRQWQLQHSKGKFSHWDLLKASVAFHKHHAKQFVWHMAGIELGEIKATAKGRGTYRTVVDSVFNAMKIDGKAVEGIKRREDLDGDEGVDLVGAVDEDDDAFGSWGWTADGS